MKTYLKEIFKDKNGQYSLRELAVAVLLLMLLTSWAADQFFNKPVHEFIFYSIASLTGAGCFSYSLERKTPETP
jgi:hypothetical protein